MYCITFNVTYINVCSDVSFSKKKKKEKKINEHITNITNNSLNNKSIIHMMQLVLESVLESFKNTSYLFDRRNFRDLTLVW